MSPWKTLVKSLYEYPLIRRIADRVVYYLCTPIVCLFVPIRSFVVHIQRVATLDLPCETTHNLVLIDVFDLHHQDLGISTRKELDSLRCRCGALKLSSKDFFLSLVAFSFWINKRSPLRGGSLPLAIARGETKFESRSKCLMANRIVRFREYEETLNVWNSVCNWNTVSVLVTEQKTVQVSGAQVKQWTIFQN